MGTSTKGIKGTALVSITKAGQAYKPKANTMHNTKATWALIQATLATKGPHTVASITKLVQKQHNHASFVGYAIRRNWLAAK